LRRHFPE